MLQNNGHSDRQDGVEQARSTVRSTPYSRLIIPALGLATAFVAVVCFADELRSTDSETPAPATQSSLTSPVALVPADVNLKPSPPEDAESAIRETVQQLLSRLESGNRYLNDTPRYAATFTQQVYKDGELLEPEQIRVKVQHEPFAVFLEWAEDGQQALYVEGQHDNKLLVHPTRGFGRLRRVWVLDPQTSLAMRGARRPITEIGLQNLVKLLLGFHKEHILASHCVEHPQDSAESATTRYTLTFDGPHQNPYFAKTVLWLCNERHIPLRIENYFWTEDNRLGSLLESYEYTDICVGDCVVDADFDRANEAYKF